ncbi:MAG: hypothetical protein ABI992_13940 [Chthoniobacterales bacterium]
MNQKPVVGPAIWFSEMVIRDGGTGKLSLINCFQRFFAPSFPFAAPSFFVTVSFSGLKGKVEKLKLSVEMVNEEGKLVLEPVTTEVATQTETEPDESFELSFFIGSCEFEKPGSHRVIFKIDDKIMGERALPGAILPQAPVPLPTPETAEAKTPAKKKK